MIRKLALIAFISVYAGGAIHILGCGGSFSDDASADAQVDSGVVIDGALVSDAESVGDSVPDVTAPGGVSPTVSYTHGASS